MKSITKEANTWLYPPIGIRNSGRLAVSEIHSLYYEESGNPDGIPVVFLHGGPGGSTNADHRRYYHPEKFRIILFDQRGCGQSTPIASLEENTTWHLVEDLEKLRNHLSIHQWVVAGGSWGSTLALSYSIRHPNRVLALILRGIFTLRKSELHWFYQDGASHIFPDYWEPYCELIPPEERDNFIQAYHRRLNSPDPVIQLEAAKRWTDWESLTCRWYTPPTATISMTDAAYLAFARIENHYFVNHGFFERDGYLLEKEGIDRIRSIPTTIVHGRYDVVCPIRTGWDLHRVFPEADFQIVSDAGHTMTEPGIARALVAASDRYASLLLLR